MDMTTLLETRNGLKKNHHCWKACKRCYSDECNHCVACKNARQYQCECNEEKNDPYELPSRVLCRCGCGQRYNVPDGKNLIACRGCPAHVVSYEVSYEVYNYCQKCIAKTISKCKSCGARESDLCGGMCNNCCLAAYYSQRS